MNSKIYANRIIGNLYLSDYEAAINYDYIRGLNITHIVTIGRELTRPFEHIDYYYISLADHPDENISEHFERVNEFILRNITAGKNVLVHCRAGISRSATLVIAYLMSRFDMPLRFAFAYVRARRPQIRPNFGFVAQLQAYDKVLKKNRGGRAPLYRNCVIEAV